jgi:hypothetical protein
VGGPLFPAGNACVSLPEAYNASGLNEQSRAAKARAPLSRDCSHLGRQTERETVPVTPECPALITGRLNFLLPVVSQLNYVACR